MPNWTREEDVILFNAVKEASKTGKTLRDAYKKACEQLSSNRNVKTCENRFRSLKIKFPENFKDLEFTNNSQWTAEEDQLLADIMVSWLSVGKSELEACKLAAEQIEGRTYLGAQARWRQKLKKQYEYKIEETKKQSEDFYNIENEAAQQEVKVVPVATEKFDKKTVLAVLEQLTGVVQNPENDEVIALRKRVAELEMQIKQKPSDKVLEKLASNHKQLQEAYDKLSRQYELVISLIEKGHGMLG